MMSAEPYEFKWNLLKAISRRIVNEVDGIARVVYDTTSKPPGESLLNASLLSHVCDIDRGR
jgi:GMP synthase PP-ATPase subunit